jgi:molybdate transport repressor ModE-like protein
MQPLRPRFKLWLAADSVSPLGDGRVELLRRIAACGSMRMAADALAMSYSRAWTLMRETEERLGTELLNRRVGGADGGGTRLTPAAHRIVKAYERLRKRAETALANGLGAFQDEIEQAVAQH